MSHLHAAFFCICCRGQRSCISIVLLLSNFSVSLLPEEASDALRLRLLLLRNAPRIERISCGGSMFVQSETSKKPADTNKDQVPSGRPSPS